MSRRRRRGSRGLIGSAPDDPASSPKPSSSRPPRGRRQRQQPQAQQQKPQQQQKQKPPQQQPQQKQPQQQQPRGRRQSGAGPGGLRDRILTLLRAPNYEPLDKAGITSALGLSPDESAQLRSVLRTMEQEGVIAVIRKDRYILPEEANLCTGILRFSRGGSARLDCGTEPHIFVSLENAGVAMNGDRVVARMVHDGHRQRPDQVGRPSAQVIRILERANETIVGTLQSSKRFTYVVPDDSRLVHNIYVLPARDGAPRTPSIGDKVVVRLEEWVSRETNPEGRIIEVLGRPRRRAWTCSRSSGATICRRNFRPRCWKKRRGCRRPSIRAMRMSARICATI
jgi:hypothetical protein